jgi:4,5:9,10-diseco-3-hydroxy-5,9,17-trioxoandrosta-1(10),2-diene-4-oate hydrolase
VNIEKRHVDVGGLPTRYLRAGTSGPPLVLLHGVGDNALDWQWVMPTLARNQRVFAPDLPGSGGSTKPDVDYSPAFFTQFLSAFLDALEVERAAVVGNSLGGLVSLRLALSDPSRVSALGLVASAGFGREVTYTLRSLALPGIGRLTVAWGKRPPGAAQRALGRSTLLFARPQSVPLEWLKEQYRLARLPGFVEAQLATVRAQVGLKGQREVLVDRLAQLEVPTIIVWGTGDRVFPYSQAKEAVSQVQEGYLELIPDCGHLPHVEQPDRFTAIVARLLDQQASH